MSFRVEIYIFGMKVPDFVMYISVTGEHSSPLQIHCLLSGRETAPYITINIFSTISN